MPTETADIFLENSRQLIDSTQRRERGKTLGKLPKPETILGLPSMWYHVSH